MVSVVYWQPTGGLMVQADRLGPKVGSHLALCCIHRMNRVNSCTVLSIKASPLKIIQHASWLIVLVASRSNITGDRCQSRRGDVIGSHSSSFVNYLGRQLHQKTCPAITWPRHTGSATGEDGVGPREEGRHWKGWIHNIGSARVYVVVRHSQSQMTFSALIRSAVWPFFSQHGNLHTMTLKDTHFSIC